MTLFRATLAWATHSVALGSILSWDASGSWGTCCSWKACISLLPVIPFVSLVEEKQSEGWRRTRSRSGGARKAWIRSHFITKAWRFHPHGVKTLTILPGRPTAPGSPASPSSPLRTQSDMKEIQTNTVMCSLAVQSSDSAYEINIFSFIPLTIDTAVSNWRHQNYVRTHVEWCRKK